MTRSHKLVNLATCLVIVGAGVLGYCLWKGQAVREDAIVEVPEAPATPPPASAPAAARPVPFEPPIPSGRYWMKCEGVYNFTGHHSQGQQGFDTDPCGWKEATVNGAKRWYRQFVQTTITSNATPDGSYGYPETRITFTARGRHAAVPCKGMGDMVPAPPDETIGNGYDSWSGWHEWKRTAGVSCDGESGIVTTVARDDHGMDGDDFNDGFLLTMKLMEGKGESVICTAISTHPFGGDGDAERAMVRFSSVQRKSAQLPREMRRSTTLGIPSSHYSPSTFVPGHQAGHGAATGANRRWQGQVGRWVRSAW